MLQIFKVDPRKLTYLTLPLFQCCLSRTFQHAWTFNKVSTIYYLKIGLLTIPFTLLGEMYPANARGLASGITLSAAFTMTFIVLKLYPTFVSMWGNNNLFLFFGVMSLLSVIYVYFMVPETKGKTLQEIGEIFRKKSVVEEKQGYLKVEVVN